VAINENIYQCVLMLRGMADPILSEIHDDNRRVIELIRISDEDVHYRQTIHATFEFIVMDEASVSSSY